MKVLRFLIATILLVGSFYSCSPEDPREDDIRNFNQEIFDTGGEDDDGTQDDRDG